MQGSNDDAAWTVLDTVTNQTGWVAWESRNYEVDTPQGFRYYKVVFTEATGANTWLGVAEIDLRSNRALSAGKLEMPSTWIRITWICLSGSIKRVRGTALLFLHGLDRTKFRAEWTTSA